MARVALWSLPVVRASAALLLGAVVAGCSLGPKQDDPANDTCGGLPSCGTASPDAGGSFDATEPGNPDSNPTNVGDCPNGADAADASCSGGGEAGADAGDDAGGDDAPGDADAGADAADVSDDGAVDDALGSGD